MTTETARGFWLALSSYALWGLFPMYFYALRDVSPGEVLVHRVAWSMVLLLIASSAMRGLQRWTDLLRSREALLPCVFSALLLSTNWLVYIYAVGNGMALEASLGYLINPLVSVVMAVLLLNEALNRYQWVAIVLAVIGVGFLVVKVGELPWVALTLAFLFGTYGLIHKKYAIDAFSGFTLETVLLTPVALSYLGYLFFTGQNAFLTAGWQTDGLLLAAGIVTSVPLLLFLMSLPQLRLSTVGILQYIAPSLQFLVAVYVLGESFSRDKFIAFCIIWLGLLVFSGDVIRQRLRKNRLQTQA